MTVTYNGTEFVMDTYRTPDAPLNVSVDEAGGMRRNYYGTAASWQRWRKHSVDFVWTGVTAEVVGSLEPISKFTGIVYGTNCDSNMFGAVYVNFRVITDSWQAELSGLNAYTVSMTWVEV
jgi:hypothetical protein